MNRWSTVSATLGGTVWLALWPRHNGSPGLIERLLLLAILVLMPLCIRLTATPDANGLHPRFYRAAQLLQPFAAAFVVLGFFLPRGIQAALLTMPWLLLTGLLALFGLFRFLTRGLGPVEELTIDAGLIYIPVGAAWLFLSRLGVNPLGFSDAIVLLTAVHFHYSGFAVPILVGMTGREIKASEPDSYRIFRTLAIAVIVGTPLLAAGITFSPVLETIAALILAGSLFVLSFVIVFDVAAHIRPLLARILLIISGTSCAVAMFFACIYATGAVTGVRAFRIPEMARIHGMVNALGFVLCGLVAWNMVLPRAKLDLPEAP